MADKKKASGRAYHEITRRDFNKGVLSAGISISLAGLFSGGILTGCGGNSNHSSGRTKNKNIHFNISHAPQNEDFFIRVAGVEYQLTRHTSQTRAEHKSSHPYLSSIADNKLTHFIVDLPLPVDAQVIIPITHTASSRSGNSQGVAGVFIHNPTRMVSQDLSVASGIALSSATDDSFNADLVDLPIEAAKSIIFHHPELMKIDPTLASQIWEHIENTTEVQDLADSISYQGPAYTTPPDGWAILTQATDADGNPATGSDGSPLYHYTLSAQTKQDAAPALKKALQSVKDDDTLRNKAWGVHQGVDSVDQSDNDTSGAASGLFQIASTDSSLKVDLKNKQPQYGIKTWLSDFDSSTRTITFVSKNNYLRHLSLYAQYLDAQGDVLLLEDFTLESFILDCLDNNSQYLALLPPELTVFGIPVYGPETTTTLTMPDEASSVRLLYGSLGSSHWDDEAFVGLLATAIIDLAIPGIMLVMAVGNLNKDLDEKKKEQTVKDMIIAVFKGLNNLNSIRSDVEAAVKGDDVPAALIKLGKTVYGMISGPAAKDMATLVAEQVGSSALEEAVPFIGWCLEVASILATIADLAETTVESMISPFVYSNVITATHDLTVTITHDPNDPAGFPATATHYKVVLYLNDNATGFVVDKEMPAGVTTNPIVETFTGVPSGGQVKAVVSLYSDTGWQAGNGSSIDLDNLAPTGSSLLNLSVQITENLVPLTASTTYSHKNKLEYGSGKYIWNQTVAPSATAFDLDSGNLGDNLGALSGITFHEPTASIGYSWRAAGTGISDCASGASAQQLHLVRGISAGQDPEANLQTLSCGFNNPTAIIFDLMSKDKQGYFIDSRSTKKYLRGIDLSAPGSIDPDSGQSYCYFTQDIDALVIHNGYAAAANWLNSKLEIMQLPPAPGADSDATAASPISGKGFREGLLNGPIALAVSSTGALLVLETVNERVQAMDFQGNPMQIFSSNTSYFMNLRTQTSTVTYLDLGVEFTGYLYVLYYRDNGSSPNDYSVDIYTPQGDYLTSTIGVAAARLVLDYWRNMYTLNYEKISGLVGAEPSVSQWIPSTP